MLRSRRFFREGQCDNFDCPEGSQTIKKFEFFRGPGVTPPSHVIDSMMMIIWLTILSDIVISKDTVISKRPDGRNLVSTFAMDVVLQKLTGFSLSHRVLLDPIGLVHWVFYVSNVWAEEYIYLHDIHDILFPFCMSLLAVAPAWCLVWDAIYWFIPN